MNMLFLFITGVMVGSLSNFYLISKIKGSLSLKFWVVFTILFVWNSGYSKLLALPFVDLVWALIGLATYLISRYKELFPFKRWILYVPIISLFWFIENVKLFSVDEGALALGLILGSITSIVLYDEIKGEQAIK